MTIPDTRSAAIASLVCCLAACTVAGPTPSASPVETSPSSKPTSSVAPSTTMPPSPSPSPSPSPAAGWTQACGDVAAGRWVTDVAASEKLLLAPAHYWSDAADASVSGVLTSAEGRSWTLTGLPSATSAESLDLATAVAIGGSGIVVGGVVGESEGAIAWRSDDGLTWARVAVDDDSGARDLAADAHGFVMVGVFGRHTVLGGGRPAVWHSPDGRVWQRVGPGSEGRLLGLLEGVIAGGPGFVAYGLVTEVALPDVLEPEPYPQLLEAGVPWVSTDGLGWTRIADPTPFAWGQILDMVKVGSGLLAFGQVRSTSDGSLSTAAWRSADGLVWARVEPGPPFEMHSAAFATVEDDRLLAFVADDLGAQTWLSSDGSTWTKLDDPVPAAEEITAAVTFGTEVVAAGSTTGEGGGATPGPSGAPSCTRVPSWLHATDALSAP